MCSAVQKGYILSLLSILCITIGKAELWAAHCLHHLVAFADAEGGGGAVAQLQRLLQVDEGVADARGRGGARPVRVHGFDGNVDIFNLQWGQYCGSVMFIPDPGSDIFPSRIRIKEFRYFNPQNCFFFWSSRKYDPGCSSRIRILIFYPSQILAPGAPDPGSTTLNEGMLSWILNAHAQSHDYHGKNGEQGRAERGGPGLRIRIRIIFESWIRIRIKVKNISGWSPGGSVDQWSQICFTLIRSRIRIQIRIQVKSWILIRIKVMRIRNPAGSHKICKISGIIARSVHPNRRGYWANIWFENACPVFRLLGRPYTYSARVEAKFRSKKGL